MPGLVAMAVFASLFVAIDAAQLAAPAAEGPGASTAPAATRPARLELRIGDRQLQIELAQEDRTCTSMPADPNGLALRPGSFTIRLKGDSTRASMIAVRDANFLSPLRAVRGPLVVHEGLGGAWDHKDMLVAEEDLDVRAGDANFFVDEWNSSPGEAAQNASRLAEKAGQTPAMLMAAKMYVEAKEALNLVIEAIDGNTPHAGDRVILVVFLQEDLGLRLKRIPFWRNAWIEVPIVFVDGPKAATTRPAGL